MKLQHLLAVGLCATATSALAATTTGEVVVTATRFEDTATNKPINVTVITRADIQRSSARTLPELLAVQAGISTRDLFGNNAANAAVDLRGFGAAAAQNTLILLDGRRITDADLSGVQWSSIPFAAIERIEIIRGSGAVPYGEGASGGVINIITRSPVGPDSKVSLSLRGGSYGMAEAQVNGGYAADNVGVDLTASRYQAEGFRRNNRNDQTDVAATLRWGDDTAALALKLAMDRQAIRLPGARTVHPAGGIDQVHTDPRGTSTPLDYAIRDGNQLALEWQQTLGSLDVNIGVARRSKNQKSYFDFGGFPSYRDSDLTLQSFTPRMRFRYGQGGSLVAGLDVHRWDYSLRTSNSAANISHPINRVTLNQRNDAWYVQNSTELFQGMTLLAGFRREQLSMSGNDTYDPAAPGAAFGSAAPAGTFSATEKAHELGARYEFVPGFAVNGKIGRSFRFANVDEIYEFGPAFTKQFQFLRPQTVAGQELWLDGRTEAGSWRTALFRNEVYDEIHLDPFGFGVGNTNLPASLRQGVELNVQGQIMDALDIAAAYSYTDARFVVGTWAGKRVPLVPNRKASLQASWAISGQTRMNTTVNYVGTQFMDNDQPNTFGAKIPAYSLVDLKLLHQVGAFRLSMSVNNLFDRQYFNYAIASTSTPGKYNVYTLPGRTVYLELDYEM